MSESNSEDSARAARGGRSESALPSWAKVLLRIVAGSVRPRRGGGCLGGLRGRHRARRLLSQSSRDRQPPRLPAEAADARVLRRRRAPGRVRRGAAQLRAHRRDPEGDAGRGARRRGREVLPAQRRQLRERDPRRSCQLRRGAQRAGRIDDHDAGRTQFLSLFRKNIYSQNLRDVAFAEDRNRADQGADSRGLYEPYCARPARIRVRLGQRDLFRQAAQGHHRRRGGDARRAAEGAVGEQPDRQSRAGDDPPALHHRPHARQRLHHRRAARRGAKAGAALPQRRRKWRCMPSTWPSRPGR